MENRLSLMKSEEVEKRCFPRFPFNRMTFKGRDRVFAVSDISYEGMRLALKDGEHSYKTGMALEGELHWKRWSLNIKGEVKWVDQGALGVAFGRTKALKKEIHRFLSLEHILQEMRLIDREGFHLELPNSLRYWLQADAPVEMFVWSHGDGEIAGFHILMLGQFIEYKDGKGLRSGVILERGDHDTPLVPEDEFIFQMDSDIDDFKLARARDIVAGLRSEHLPSEAKDFLKIKLGLSTE